jgi:hypothetical protein
VPTFKVFRLPSSATKHVPIGIVMNRNALPQRPGANASPLEDRLKRLLSTIPIALQCEGLSLSVLQASLRGRWRGNAHPGEVCRALRSFGFKRFRMSDNTHGSRALWFPNSSSPD